MGAARDPGTGSGSALRRWLRPPRRLRPTRAGWIFFALTFGVAFAALNTGNNLLYLMLSLMLAFLALSGFFSEAALRGIEVRRRLPAEIVASRPARVVLRVANTQRRVPAFAVAVEDRLCEPGGGEERAAGRVFALRIAPGESLEGCYRVTVRRRGEARFTRFRVSTRFPFGLFQKSRDIELAESALVYPPLTPGLPPPRQRRARPLGEGPPERRRGGPEVGGVREYANGDSARRILWRASLRRGALVVRDTERRSEAELEVHLATRGRRPGPTFERSVSRAASEVVAALEAGCEVALSTDGLRLPPAAGSRQRTRLLCFLARIAPEPAAREGDA